MKKYEKIASQLIEDIHNGRFSTEKFLPSERHLMTSFGVSRGTIRSALKRLENNGYIEILPKSGSKIIEHEKIDLLISDLSGSTEKKQFFHQNLQTEVLLLKQLVVDEQIREKSGFSVGERIWYLIRRRKMDDQAIVLEIDYLLISIISHLTEEIAMQSLYYYFEKELHLTIANSKKEISVENTHSNVSNYLNLKKNDTHMILVKNWAYLDDYTQFQFTESYHQADSFKFVLLANRQLNSRITRLNTLLEE